jgi:hypothetical protein
MNTTLKNLIETCRQEVLSANRYGVTLPYAFLNLSMMRFEDVNHPFIFKSTKTSDGSRESVNYEMRVEKRAGSILVSFVDSDMSVGRIRLTREQFNRFTSKLYDVIELALNDAVDEQLKRQKEKLRENEDKRNYFRANSNVKEVAE